MFMTIPQFEQAIPKGLSPDGQRCWRVMELSFNHHWFFVTVREREADFSFQRSLILGLDQDLLGMLRSDPPFEFASIKLALPPGVRGEGWRFEQVRAVWSAHDTRNPRQDLLLFETAGGRMIEPYYNTTADGIVQRQLLLQLS